MVNCVVIDDNKEIVDVFCDLLELCNIEVLAKGYNGQDAEKLYEKHRPDVIFVDLLMPEYDGFYAIERIRDIDPDAKIIIVTGDLKAGESALLDSYKVDIIIYKPFDVHDIKQAINDILLR